MKDARFIELVNLYIDRQISPAETAELEAELQANARRRQIYHQYCRMHRATKLVYESFRANAEQPAGAATGEPATIARFEEGLQRKRRNRARWLYASGGLAAAACFAAVMAIRTGQFSGATADTTAATPAIAAVGTPAAPQPADTAAPAAKPKTEYIALFGNSDGAQDYATLLNTLRQEQQRMLSLNHAQLPRESLFDDGVFDAKPMFSSENRSIYPAKPKADSQQSAEFTAFQFQR